MLPALTALHFLSAPNTQRLFLGYSIVLNNYFKDFCVLDLFVLYEVPTVVELFSVIPSEVETMAYSRMSLYCC